MAPKLLLLAFAVIFVATAASGKPPGRFLQSTKPSHSGGSKEKLSHLHFYYHDIGGGSNPTVVTVVPKAARNGSTTQFGLVAVMDDPLTVGPELSSGLVGRAQGLYASASLETEALILAMNLVFVEGKFNGSTVAVLGHNQFSAIVREMPIIGGSGMFRFARGYVEASTYSFDADEAIIEFYCYVLHY